MNTNEKIILGIGLGILAGTGVGWLFAAPIAAAIMARRFVQPALVVQNCSPRSYREFDCSLAARLLIVAPDNIPKE